MFQQRAPHWIVVGAILLTCTAGWVNAIGLLGAFHEALTHVTGTVSHSALRLASGELAAAARALGVVASFAAGAVVAGVIIGSPEAKRGRRYTLALACEASLLAVAWWLFERGHPRGENLAAASAGLQNGLATTWSGAVLRTSHMTGVVTDLGLAIGYRLRRAHVRGRGTLQLAMLFGFFLGCTLGSLAWAAWGYSAFVGPIALCVFAATAYQISWRSHEHAHPQYVHHPDPPPR